MDTRAETTRNLLVDTAIDLFAERGVHSVSMAEIVRQAGQRNLSALHYHFGGREGLLQAIMERYIPVIADRRLELLEQARLSGPADLRAPVEALVRPVAELAQRGRRERGYLLIGAELATGPDRNQASIQALFLGTAGYQVRDLLAERLPALAPAVLRARFHVCAMLTGRAASDRVRMLGEGPPDQDQLASDAAFVDNLVDMMVGALGAPSTVAP